MQNLGIRRADWTAPFYLKDLSVLRFWYSWRSWNQSPADTEGWLYVITSTQVFFYIIQKCPFLFVFPRCFLDFVTVVNEIFFPLSFLIGCWWCIGTIWLLYTYLVPINLLYSPINSNIFSSDCLRFYICHDFLCSCFDPFLPFIELIKLFCISFCVEVIHSISVFYCCWVVFWWLSLFFQSVYLGFQLVKLYLWSPLPTCMFLLSYILAHLCFIRHFI